MARPFDLIIKNGKVFLPSGLHQTDLGIIDGKISAIGDLSPGNSNETLDARSKLVLPGMIDPHIHFSDYDPDSGLSAVDDFSSASRAAAFGGNTTLLDFAVPIPGKKVGESIAARRSGADQHVAVDYSVHVMVDQSSDIIEQDLTALAKWGVNSIKIFTTFGRMTDDWEVIRLFSLAKDNRLLVMVHAESAPLISGYESLLVEEGRLGSVDFPVSRPEITEVEAVQRAILLAEYTGAVVYIVHISSGAAVQLIRQAKKRGLRIFGETAPHYLILNEEVYSHENGPAYLCCPPIRTKEDNKILWEGLIDGTLSTIGSDHCGFSFAQKMYRKNDFRTNIKGLPTLESRVPVMFSEGVGKGRISLSRFVEVMSTNSARIFGLYPRKGTISPGSDADLCILDPNAVWRMTTQSLHCDWGWTPYEGKEITGKPITTLLRGKIIVDGDLYTGSPGDGKFISRPPFEFMPCI